MRDTKEIRRSVKGGLDAEDARSRRAESKIELRKVKKDDALAKRRNFAVIEDEPVPAADVANGKTSALPQRSDIAALARQTLEYIQNGCRNDQTGPTVDAVQRLRKLLSIPDNPPIDEVISAGLVPAFVELLATPLCGVELVPADQKQALDMSFEAAWCLTNIASGTTNHCRIVVDAGAVPPLLGLLSSPSVETREQAVWCISNIAGDCAAFRDVLLNCGAMGRVIEMIVATGNAPG